MSVIKAEVGSAICFSSPQYAIPQLCRRSAQNALAQVLQICHCVMRNSAIADISTTHNHSKEKIKLQKISFIKIKNN
jgi:fructose 1,6-bisphosphatase